MKLCTFCNTHFEDRLETCPNESAQLVYIGKRPLIGSQIGDKYKVISAVGAGSMGVVYKAVQNSTGREMAVKVLHGGAEGGDSAHVRRFRREAKAVSALNHENIVRLFDFGFMEDGQPYIVTEFIKGKTLSQILRERGRLTLKEASPIMHQVCNAVEEAHRLKIVHRDLKPENIILQEPDQRISQNTKHGWRNRRIKVVDFGVAKLSSDANSSSASLTIEGKVCGSPGYMSPEQCKGLPVDVRSDIYSLGIVLYEVISGHRPFSADTVMGLLFMHVNDKPPPMNAFCLDLDVPSQLEQVIRKSLSKNPDERHNTVAELWQEFEMACNGKSKESPKQSQKHSSNWIPFSGVENKLLQEEARKLAEEKSSAATKVSVAPIATRSQSSTEDEEEYEPHKFNWLGTPVKISLLVGAIALLVMTKMDWFPVRIHSNADQIGQADALIKDGQLAEALMTIERVKKQMKTNGEDMEGLNSLYLQVGQKYAQNKDWDNAMESLQRIQPKSKYYQEATQLFKKYRKLASAQVVPNN
jgi:eukaryotic-like serine/threonine-protein kinase